MHVTPRPSTRRRLLAGLVVALGALAPATAAVSAVAASSRSVYTAASSAHGAAGPTVWLCRPGLAADPCASSLATTIITASGRRSVVSPVATSSKFDCFYAYPTVSLEPTPNADLSVQSAETTVATYQASRFSTVCRVYAPMYRQFTLRELFEHPDLSATSAPVETAYSSLRAGFEDYLSRYNDGRPIVLIGHSQGSALLITLIKELFDTNPSLRRRLVLAIVPGGNVVVPTGALVGGSFEHVPACSSSGETGCVIAYSSFPGVPPATTLFGRPGQGVSLLSGQTSRRGVEVLCVNPASLGGGSADLDPFFPSEGKLATPWVEFPGLYSASCQTSGGASWLQVTKVSGASDLRPVVSERDGPDWGYHSDDVNLALGDLVADTARAEATWSTKG